MFVDESAARRQAKKLNLLETETIGVLLRAKREHVIAPLRPELDELQAASFWIGEMLYQKVLNAVDE